MNLSVRQKGYAMKYHELLNTIEDDLKNNERLKSSCIRFINYVASKKDKSLFDYLSFDIISKITNDEDYNDILSLTHYLTDPSINVLILQFHYFSIATDREEPEPISVTDVYEALESNTFYDPQTGIKDPEYKEYLKLFYTLSKSAKELNKK